MRVRLIGTGNIARALARGWGDAELVAGPTIDSLHISRVR